MLPTPTPTPTPTTAQAHPTAAGTPALLVSRVVLAVLVPAASGKATIPHCLTLAPILTLPLTLNLTLTLTLTLALSPSRTFTKATILPSYVVDYALEALAAQLD